MHLEPLTLLLLQIALILGLSRVMGAAARYVGQPQVVGEMVAGIMLGPSLLGLLFPGTYSAVFPAASLGSLGMLSQVGVILFLFLIGLELDPKLIRNRGHAAVVISHVSIIAPFLLGAGLTLYLYPHLFHAGPHMRFTAVALFMGAAMSITAFPVLARILTERNLHKTKVGAITITCAAVDDVTAWCLLAFVVGIARANSLLAGAYTALFAALYVTVMFFVVRPFLAQLEQVYERQGRLSQVVVAVILMLVVASALLTELIGIHALFGAFLMGAIMPKGTRFVRHLSEKLEDVTVVFLLPLFFANAGLKAKIGLIDTPALWVDTALIIAVACLGKFGGSTLAAKACGFDWRESSAIGTLMNTRGLMELLILTIGRDLGVITDAVYTMMVLMALATTAMTTPVLAWVYPRRLFAAERAAADAAGRRGYTVLIPVSHPRSGGPLLQLADTISGPGEEDRRVLALHLRPPPAEHEAYAAAAADHPAAHADGGSGVSLAPLLATARERNIPVKPVTFVSRDIAGDIAAVTAERRADLVLMGFHNPVFGKALLGGTVASVLRSAPADVAVFVDRGFLRARKVLVPYLGGPHDRLALDLASRIGRHARAEVTVLHVVAPEGAVPAKALGARAAVDKAFHEPGQPHAVHFKTVTHDSPVSAVLEAAKDYDLVVVGVAEQWGLESQLFGLRAERIATESPTSLLIVRRHIVEAGEAGAAKPRTPTIPPMTPHGVGPPA